jgi:NADH:ubiquinone oxidoreductase subunit 3 (subunit A)
MLLFENAYVSLFFYFTISLLLALVLFILPLVLSTSNISQEHEKVSAYECGFEPFSDTRNTFDVHFFIVAILFILFDLELLFIFP